MDPAVLDQRLERPPGHLAADRIEAGDDHRVGRVVDDDVHPGGGLERADVPALAADDPALHLVAGERHRGHRALRRVLRGEPLDGDGDDPPRLAVGVALGLLLDVAHQRRGLAPRLVLDALENLPPGLFRGEPGDPLQLDPLLLRQPVRPRPRGRGAPAPAALSASSRLAKRALPGLDLLELPLLRPGALFRPPLQPLPLLPAALHLAVEILPQLERLHLAPRAASRPWRPRRRAAASVAHPVALSLGRRRQRCPSAARRCRRIVDGDERRRATTSPAATPASVGRSRDWGIGSLRQEAAARLAALGRRAAGGRGRRPGPTSGRRSRGRPGGPETARR